VSRSTIVDRLLESVHGSYVHARRASVLSRAIAELVPASSRILDVGAGDGLIAALIAEQQIDVSIEGVDTLLRPTTLIPVRTYDGVRLPFASASFDVVILVDVLHHTNEPLILLREAARVSRRLVVIKDHCRDGLFAHQTLYFMDWVGNSRHGVSIPATYLPEWRWREAFAEVHLTVTHWSTRLPLYNRWVSWLFGRSLHFIARLEKTAVG
jgi:SAM-dependent methyltransferase